jgi:hypothetical protein
MASNSNNKNLYTDEWVQWIEDGIAKDYINYYDYKEFQNIQHIGSGKFGRVNRATWKSRGTIIALKSFEFDTFVMKEIVNEVYKVVDY